VNEYTISEIWSLQFTYIRFMIEPRIVMLQEKKLIGKRLMMSLENNRTPELWRGFMPYRKEIKNKVSNDLINMQVFDSSFDFKNFVTTTVFERWAAIEVTDFNYVPPKMETYVLKSGWYAVFHYAGLPENYMPTFQYIFHQWFPQSMYEVDQREHFEILGDKYKSNDATSEEDIWIPIKKKK
jgi:AraC family transcriptional regulator